MQNVLVGCGLGTICLRVVKNANYGFPSTALRLLRVILDGDQQEAHRTFCAQMTAADSEIFVQTYSRILLEAMPSLYPGAPSSPLRAV